MSTQTATAPSIDDCLALNLENGRRQGDRYYGKINDKLALCVYTVGRSQYYYAQLFPLSSPEADMHNCFVNFVLRLGKLSDGKERMLREQYQYIHTAQDVLTLKCFIHEAEDQFWRLENARLEDR